MSLDADMGKPRTLADHALFCKQDDPFKAFEWLGRLYEQLNGRADADAHEERQRIIEARNQIKERYLA